MSNQETVTIEQVAEAAEPEMAAPVKDEVSSEEAAPVVDEVSSEPEAPATDENSTNGEVSSATDSAHEEKATPATEGAPAEDLSNKSPAADTPVPNENLTTSSIFNLKKGQYLTGSVKNITNFGAFIDLGLAQDGLVHISELARHKVANVSDVVSVGQEVEVWVKRIDQQRGRISLTMVRPIGLRLRDISEDDVLEGVVTRLEAYGAFVNINSERDGLVHISQIAHDYIKHPEEALSIGDQITVKVLKVNRKKRQVDLSIKALIEPPAVEEVAELPKASVVPQEPDEIVEEEAIPTAMALAFATIQNKGQETSKASDEAANDTRSKKQQEMDEIIARTLASSK